MAKFSCFSLLVGRKNKYKEVKQSTYLVHEKTLLKALQVKLEHHTKYAETDNKLNSTSFSVSVPLEIQGNSTCKMKVLRHEIPVGAEAAAAEAAYEGEDEHDGNSPIYENSPLKRDFSDFDLKSQMANRGKNSSDSELTDNEMNDKSENKLSGEDILGAELIQSGHISDPGTGKPQFWASPKLKRSCSNLETRDMFKNIADQLSPSRSHSFEDLHHFSERLKKDIAPRVQGSPTSVMTPGSADRVMLKKHSSSQVLPSRSRRLWWKLFLWSHRNLHKPRTVKPTQLSINHSPNQRGGYSSDTLEPNRSKESRNNSHIKNKNSLKWGDFQSGISGSWPQNQWVAFSTESSTLNRVDEWVNSLEKQPLFPINDEDPPGDEGIVFSPSPETSRSPARSPYHMMTPRPNVSIPEEVLHANSLILSLNSSSTTAHISGMGLKVIPNMSRFSSLKSVNLSGNFIVHITPGSLPKCVHTLNLSRNKIVTIEGLRELTRLRVLDLSYNRISRIGHGLSNCTLIKELYLAGNKISDVEGLHRLLKLTVLDLSFNKITTAKALGQLVANYNSLLALNLLGNPIQNNIGEDQLRKAVSGLLPQLAYLNKQPIKPAREVAMDGVAKAALGNNAWTSRRKSVKRVGQGGSPSSSGHRSSIGSHGQKGRHRSKSGSYQQSPMGRMSSTVASSR